MQTIGKLLPLVTLIFIGFGDRFLPRPLSDYSFHTRNTINQAIVGMFPHKNLDSPYKKSDEIIKQAEDEVRQPGSGTTQQ